MVFSTAQHFLVICAPNTLSLVALRKSYFWNLTLKVLQPIYIRMPYTSKGRLVVSTISSQRQNLFLSTELHRVDTVNFSTEKNANGTENLKNFILTAQG